MQAEIKILLVDDDENDYILTKRLLQRIEGSRYAIAWARTYGDGIRTALEGTYDCCLLDYRLGARNGIEFLNEARDKGVTIPMILLTGQGYHEIDVQAAKSGATDYMVKGEISPALLERSIRYAIENKRIERARDAALQAARESEEKYLFSLLNKSKEELSAKDQFLRAILRNLRDSVVACDADGNLIDLYDESGQAPLIHLSDWSSRTELYEANGRKRLTTEEMPLYRALHEGLVRGIELVGRTRDGKPRALWSSGQAIFDENNNKLGAIAVMHDITERKIAEQKMMHNAFHDALTGLPNRTAFTEHLKKAIDNVQLLGSISFAVLSLDFDRFKTINDSLGHAAGDELLKMISRRLRSIIRTGDIVARLGGDEFAILLAGLFERGEAVEMAEKINEGLRAPFDLANRQIFISASIGIVFNDHESKAADEMLRNADIAMYHAKSQGRARYQVFDKEMHAAASKKLEFESEMRLALERNEFEIHYQPIIHLQTDELDGFEALVRWRHPTRGLVPPMDFIPLAEETGLIIPLGKWILHESCRQLREWKSASRAADLLSVSVNLSCKQFLQPDLADQISEELRSTGLRGEHLKLEITESHLLEDVDTSVITLNKLRDIGVRISLDDFGTGYSSLSYLHRLPIDFLKIDRSFVSRMRQGEENAEIVATIIKLAKSLKMVVVAEGIETADQLTMLRHLKCEFGQGYYFSKPMKDAAAMILSNPVASAVLRE